MKLKCEVAQNRNTAGTNTPKVYSKYTSKFNCLLVFSAKFNNNITSNKKNSAVTSKRIANNDMVSILNDTA